jgi:hypothetical protein
MDWRRLIEGVNRDIQCIAASYKFDLDERVGGGGGGLQTGEAKKWHIT